METNSKEEAKMKAKEEVKQQLEDSNHALANGILCAINDVTEVKLTVKVVNEKLSSIDTSIADVSQTMVKIQKVLTGDPQYHEEGLILGHQIAKERHFEILKKIDELESKRIKDIENRLESQKDAAAAWRSEKGQVIDKIPAIEKDVARIMTWGSAGLVFLTLLELGIKLFVK